MIWAMWKCALKPAGKHSTKDDSLVLARAVFPELDAEDLKLQKHHGRRGPAHRRVRSPGLYGGREGGSSLDAPGVNGRERDDEKERDEKAQASYEYRRSDRSDEPCWPRAVDDVRVAAEGACHLHQFQRRATCRQGAPSCLDLDSFCEPTLFLLCQPARVLRPRAQPACLTPCRRLKNTNGRRQECISLCPIGSRRGQGRRRRRRRLLHLR